MSSGELQDLLQNADQLFDENKYQEAVDILKKFPVIIHLTFSFCITFLKTVYFAESRRCKCVVA